MLNEERVLHMTHMEMERKKNGEHYRIRNFYDKKDYLSYQTVVSFVEGTVLYGGGYFGLVCLVFLITGLNVTDLAVSLAVFAGIIGYLVFLIFYLQITRKRAIKRYEAGMEYLAREDRLWERLSELYDEEERKNTLSIDKIMEEQDDSVY